MPAAVIKLAASLGRVVFPPRVRLAARALLAASFACHLRIPGDFYLRQAKNFWNRSSGAAAAGSGAAAQTSMPGSSRLESKATFEVWHHSLGLTARRI